MAERYAAPRTGGAEPLGQFCCGCELQTGIKLVLVWNALSCSFYMATAWMNIVMEVPGIGHEISLSTQTFNCFFAIASLPFLVSGFMGVRDKSEVHLRIYLYWLLLTFALDTTLISILMTKNACARIPWFLAEQGGSWACGMMRVAAIFLILTLVSIQSYSVFVIWSYCEKLLFRGSVPAFNELVGEAKLIKEVFQPKCGLFGTGSGQPVPYPVAYGSIAAPAFGGGKALFGGKFHDTTYPPKPPGLM